MSELQELQLLKISWISLLATGIGILGFGIVVTIYPQIAGPTTEEGLMRAIGVATTGMGTFGIMITLMAYRRKEKWMVYSLVLSYFLDDTLGGRIATGN